ncbi:MAG: hypothetical protein HC922_11340 [Leptolyngbyaceae cyanobacterium SM2_3_12]|nr:hypothetical protein [Leptolyngbyaceae cyanobacterium SM2_3_12]
MNSTAIAGLGGVVHPQGFLHLESFSLEGTTPLWVYALGDSLLEKRLWMEPGANTTYVRYTLKRATAPLTLTLKVLINYRNHHHSTQATDWRMEILPWERGLKIIPKAHLPPFYLLSETAFPEPAHTWYRNYALAMEEYRGIHPLMTITRGHFYGSPGDGAVLYPGS